MSETARHHLIAFLVKFGATVASIYFIALFYPVWGHMHFGHALILGLVIAVVGYLADLIIPRAVNYIVAVAFDLVTAVLIVGFGNVLFPGMSVSWTFAWFVGLLVAGVEIFYHYQFVRKSNEPVR
ncbi:DUF2512 family protein [Tumebacillus sp. DT12]|uniref:DUF2512 family protein n=1 Tax=Tumebacillus lacus TaxID=2995335 RepID=A0ABT3X447_9BACL|nr:DUF2512 family protein [Tumebacillus lacus]MCX7570747.1 DUF2512 family protein [Tumebacillus lacus]